jgi:hypothetical protein
LAPDHIQSTLSFPLVLDEILDRPSFAEKQFYSRDQRGVCASLRHHVLAEEPHNAAGSVVPLPHLNGVAAGRMPFRPGEEEDAKPALLRSNRNTFIP